MLMKFYYLYHLNLNQHFILKFAGTLEIETTQRNGAQSLHRKNHRKIIGKFANILMPFFAVLW